MITKRSRENSYQHLLCSEKFLQGACSSVANCSKSHHTPYRLRLLVYMIDTYKDISKDLSKIKLDIIYDTLEQKSLYALDSSIRALSQDLRRLSSEVDRYLHTSGGDSPSRSRTYSMERPTKKYKTESSQTNTYSLTTEVEETTHIQITKEQEITIDSYELEEWFMIEDIDTNSHYYDESIDSITEAQHESLQDHTSIVQNKTQIVDLHHPKLEIVLDIDSTLLEAIQEELLIVPVPKDAHKIQFEISRKKYSYYIFLRPGIFDFLNNLTSFCRPWIYTSGAKEYTKEVIKLLDPSGLYFSSRILTSESCDSKSRKKSLSMIYSLFPEFNSDLALILDDNVAAWETSDWNKLIPTMAFSPFKKIRHYLYHPKLEKYMFDDIKQRFLDRHDHYGNQIDSLYKILRKCHAIVVENSNLISAECAFNGLRSKVMSGIDVSFSKYLEKLDNKIYTRKKYITYKYMCEILGARITDHNQHAIQVLENVTESKNEKKVDSSEIIRCYFHMIRFIDSTS